MFSGCTSLDKQFAKTVKNSYDLIGPDYVRYVQNDENLDDDSKETRLRHHKVLDDLLTEAAHGE